MRRLLEEKLIIFRAMSLKDVGKYISLEIYFLYYLLTAMIVHVETSTFVPIAFSTALKWELTFL